MSSVFTDLPFEPEVALTTCNGHPTDISAPIAGNQPRQRASLAYRVVPVEAVPIFVFRHLQHQEPSIDMDRLYEIWTNSFE